MDGESLSNDSNLNGKINIPCIFSQYCMQKWFSIQHKIAYFLSNQNRKTHQVFPSLDTLKSLCVSISIENHTEENSINDFQIFVLFDEGEENFLKKQYKNRIEKYFVLISQKFQSKSIDSNEASRKYRLILLASIIFDPIKTKTALSMKY